ncbi:hypothetical protein HNV12_01700 [Methanococcoides sp. SA1]|nr:hypothetical protein [Methanococcoides sp. SA1]
MGEVYLLTAGLQIAIFSAVFVMSLLIQRDRVARFFSVVSFLLLVSSFLDFIHVFSNIYPEITPWLSSTSELFLITHPIYLVVGFILLGALKQLRDE